MPKLRLRLSSMALLAVCTSVLILSGGCTTTAGDATAVEHNVASSGAEETARGVPLAPGFDAGEFSAETRAQDDFFEHINANWIADNEIPADRTSYGVFNVVFDQTELQVRTLIEAAAEKARAGDASEEEATIGALYLSFMDENAVNAAGLAPLGDLLRRVDGLTRHQQLAALLGSLQPLDIDLPVVFYVDGDAADPTRSLAYLWQGGLGLPDRDYYLSNGDKFEEIRAAYLSHIERMHQLAGWSDAAKQAKAIYAFETALAQRQWSSVQNRNRERIYTNKISVERHPQKEFWQRFLVAGGFGAPATIVLAQDDYFAGLPEFINQTPLATWQAYLRFRILESFASYLAEPLAVESFEFRGKILRGQKEERPRWKRGVATVNSLLGEAVGKQYVAEHFPPTAKAKIAEMVENLRIAFGESIDELDWMEPVTKRAAREKLAAFSKKVGYPDVWRDYSSLDLSPTALVSNVRQSRRLENERQIAKLITGVDRNEWGMSPQTINAYYRPTMNEIVFPAAILQPPFFDPMVDDAFNYGAIGGVIGHEFSHGFDDQGRKFDGAGALRDWWSESDAKAYSERANALVAQYNGFKPLPDLNINGQLTLGENIGDLAGLTIAYKAYKRAAEKVWGAQGAPSIAGYTADQRFFIGYAYAWRGTTREETLRERLLSDPHSPGKYRVIGVLRNMDAFYEAFDVQPGDGMYLRPSERVRIW